MPPWHLYGAVFKQVPRTELALLCKINPPKKINQKMNYQVNWLN